MYTPLADPLGLDGRLLLLLLALFGLAALCIGVASLLPATREQARALWPIFRNEFLLVGAVVLPVYLGGWVLVAVLMVAGLRGQYELLILLKPGVGRWGLRVTLLAGALPILGAALTGYEGLWVGGLAAVALVLMARPVLKLPLGVPLLSLLMPVALVALMPLLRAEPHGGLWLLALYALVESNDAFALLFGKLFGRIHPFPRLSPGKTLEGLVLGVAVAGLLGWLLIDWWFQMAPDSAALLVAGVLAAGLAGDLGLSAIKRHRGKKDFAALSRMHGGILDIYDSLLFAVPAFYLLRTLVSS